jgi:hypothetical protein
MFQEATGFDTECDLAAIVYGEPDQPDRLLQKFARDLLGHGHRVVGLIQTRLDDEEAAVTILPTGETIPLFQKLGSLSGSCRLDPGRLAEAAGRVNALIETGADLVVINRFGKAEAEGKGLIDEIAHALGADIPVVVAVPDYRLPEWLSFCGGLGIKLPCRSESLENWWKATIIGGRQPENQGWTSICELSK